MRIRFLLISLLESEFDGDHAPLFDWGLVFGQRDESPLFQILNRQAFQLRIPFHGRDGTIDDSAWQHQEGQFNFCLHSYIDLRRRWPF